MDQKTTAPGTVNQFLISMGYIAIPFRQNIAGQLLITAKINGVEGIYILDTGAGQTVVDYKQTGPLQLILNHDEKALTGGGVGAHSMETIPSAGNTLEINDFSIDNLVIAVMSLETAWEALALAGAQDELGGIIGVDVLKSGKAIIDFSAMTLYLLPMVLETRTAAAEMET